MVRPLTETKTLSAERQEARRKVRTAQSSGLRAPKISCCEPTRTFWPATIPSRPDPMTSCTNSWHLEIKPFTNSGRHDGCGNHVLRSLLKGTCKPQDLVRAFAGRCLNGNETRTAHRESTGLVKQDRVRARQSFKRGATLYENSAPSRLRNTGNERDRRRENERAGVATTKTASPRMGSPVSSQAPPATRTVTGSKSSA